MLNFDPYVWLAENAQSARPPAKVANLLRRDGCPQISKLAGLAGPHAETDISSDAGCATNAAHQWRNALAGLDPNCPIVGFDAARWRWLVTDGLWLARTHGDAAALLGWNASDLFGVDPLPGWGGLADRLEGARHVTFTDTVAHWRGDELTGWLWRKTLPMKPLLWEV